MVVCIPRGNPAGSPRLRSSHPAYPAILQATITPFPPISIEPPNVGMGTVRGLWITRRVPLYTVTFPSKHLLQVPTERIWPPQINSPTRRASAL